MLADLRSQWEHGSSVEFHRMEENFALTIVFHNKMSGDHSMYSCLRYFTICDVWQVSVDHQECYLTTALKWLDSQVQ